MKTPVLPLLFSLCLLCASPALAADSAVQKLLPAPACTAGWIMDGKVALYNRDNLFERIDGESELYFPYGFDVLISARYAAPKNPEVALEADIYRMGSLLDAFGMFANYRRAEDSEAAIGGEGTVSPTQLFFYQDRYLVRLQASGPANPPPEAFLACARAIARNLPPNPGRPKELDAFGVPGVEQRSARYIASSLLGYDFFRHGLMADAVVKGQPVQLFLVNEASPLAARAVFEQYRAYLKSGGQEARVSESPEQTTLTGVDPLYGTVVVEQAGRSVIGAVRVPDSAAAHQLLEQIRRRTAGQ